MTNAAESVRQVLARYQGQAEDLTDRILAELTFARQLLELHPEKAPDWQPLLDEAAAKLEHGATSLRGLRRAVAQAETVLAPVAETAKTYTVYLVGHAHIDMNWMWSWPETVAVTNDTFTTVLELMDEFPTFHFSQSQASVYRIIEEHHPELLEQIARRVREGRWEVTASHWVEGDKNLVSGESLCRHLLYTRRYMQQLFGLSPEDVPLDWTPDTFGFAHTIPMYLVRGGVKYVYLHRPGTLGPKRPWAFWWQGPDGSRVLVRNDMALGYNGVIIPAVTQHLTTFARETGLPFFMYVYGVGDHGGGPTRRDLARALEMNSWPVFPNLTMSTAREFYERLEAEGADLPVLDCELNVEFTGCYTSQSLIKKSNRYGEKKLVDAEWFSTLAWAAGVRDYPQASLTAGWQDTLFNHFHDILPGSGVRDTRTYTHGLHQETLARTSAAEAIALRRLAQLVDTISGTSSSDDDVPAGRVSRAQGAGVGFHSDNGGLSLSERGPGQGVHPVVVFNPVPWERAEVIETVVWDAGQWGFQQRAPHELPYAVEDPAGALVAAQQVDHGHYWGHEFVRLCFPVDVGAGGFARYLIRENVAAEPAVGEGAHQLGRSHHCPYAQWERSPEGLENEFLRLEVDPTTGGISSLSDKQTGNQLLGATPAPLPVEYVVERPHGMTAWLVDHSGPPEPLEVTGLQRKLGGPYKASLDVRVKIHESEFVLTYELRAGDPKLYLHLEGTWFQRGTPQTGVPTLRLALPLALTSPQAQYEIPFGAIDRDATHGEELPALRWVYVTGRHRNRRAGLILFNDCKHGHSLEGTTLRLTLIRGSYDPDPLPEIGRHEIHLALQPTAGRLPTAQVIRAAASFEQELRPVSTDLHAGSLPPAAALVSFEPDTVMLTAVKKAEDDESLVLRLHDPTGAKEETTASVKLNKLVFGRVRSVREVDLMERPRPHSTARKNGNIVRVVIPKRGLSSVKVELERKQ